MAFFKDVKPSSKFVQNRSMTTPPQSPPPDFQPPKLVPPLETIGPITDAREFLDQVELLAGSSHWGHFEPQFGLPPVVFRGEADSVWELRPRIFRPGFDWDLHVDVHLKSDWGVRPLDIRVTELNRWLYAETRAVLHFLVRGDALGLMPFVNFEAFEQWAGETTKEYWNKYKTLGPFEPYPPAHIVDYFALAQHYGVPTRLLDWTESAAVATFFAAYGAWSFRAAYENYETKPKTSEFDITQARETPIPEGKCIAVYAASVGSLGLAAFSGSGNTATVQTSRSSNPFLLAQRGLFVNMPQANRYYLEHDRWPRLTDYLTEPEHAPVLRKVLYPASGCTALLRLLRQRGITPSTVMPTLRNAATHAWYNRVLTRAAFP